MTLTLVPKEDDAAQSLWEDELRWARLRAVEAGRDASEVLRDFSLLCRGLDSPLGRFRIVGAA